MAPDNTARSRCRSVGRLTSGLLLSFLALSTPVIARNGPVPGSQGLLNQNQLPPLAPIIPDPRQDAPLPDAERFTLRHMFHHGAYLYPQLHKRKDIIDPEAQLYTLDDEGREQAVPPLMIRSQPLHMQRLKDRRPDVIDPMITAAREQGEVWALSPSAWTVDEIPGPNISDKNTILSLAEMAAAAYHEEPNTRDWQNISLGFRNSTDFGWEGDGLRGHVWANEHNSTIVISLKGTSVAVFDGDETTTGDKENDNLFFSCCCGQQGQLTWRKVCDCATSTYTCNNTCVTKSLRQEHRYYTAARELYTNVTALYPDSNVWVSGHSLGGAVSSLLGMTYGLPTVTFESPPDNLAAKRLGLPLPPGSDPDSPQRHGYTGTYHVGHTADPIFLGSCNGITSPCSFAGYALESACHTGQECVYDVVADHGWRVALTTHSIRGVIDNVLMKYDTVPVCEKTPECVDCPLWKFYESNSSETTTSSSSSSTRSATRTETCKTPGWWGCLDESTTYTGTPTTTIDTTTSTTSTCKTPGWFGCYDKTTTTTTTTEPGTVTQTETTSTTCYSPGFFGGCNDPTSISADPTTTTCATPGWFGCKDIPSTTDEPSITSPPPEPTITPTATETSSSTSCQSPEWFGLICADPSPTTEPEGKSTSSCETPEWFGLICADKSTTTTTTTETATTTTTTSVTITPTGESELVCKEWAFLGLWCKEWVEVGSVRDMRIEDL